MNGKQVKISIRGLKKSFGNNFVLQNISLDIRESESVVIIGASGSGKSVLVKTILGLVRPDFGSIKIDGIETINIDDKTRGSINQGIGMLFQGAALFDSLKIWENIVFTQLTKNKIHQRKARAQALELLTAVGLDTTTADRFPADISVGAQKRVGLARAIATKPGILFFDEPTTGIDPIMGDVIDKLIVKCVKSLGATAVTITHDMESALRIADRIAMIHNGEIIWADEADKIYNSGNEIVDHFINGRINEHLSTCDQLGVSD